jgi:hypothetical protein
MMMIDFLQEKAQDEAIMAAARKWATISLGHGYNETTLIGCDTFKLNTMQELS